MKPARSGRVAPSAGIATGLVAPLALGAPGNLDAGFADHGRIVLVDQYGSQAWAVEALEDDGVIAAGGEAYFSCSYWYYDCDFGDNFASELTAEGALDLSFAAAKPTDIEVRDAVRQPDGKIVMVGRWVDEVAPDVHALAVYRLEASGTLDTSFGTQGIFKLPSDVHGTRNYASSVVLDPDGRIVVSGASTDRLIVVRLLADGTLDTSFGGAGVYTGPVHNYESRTFVERTVAGYRVATMGASRCQIVALTAIGVVDGTFGAAGVATVQTPQGEATSCSAMASQPDGSLLLSGIGDAQPFVTRMLATGAPDPAFSASSVADVMAEATAIAVDDTGRILVAGSGEQGTMVMRLDAGGGLDASFGESGTTFVDLASDYGSWPRINAMDVGPDGRVLAAGGDLYASLPFVVQLLGDGGSDSPGILSVVQPGVESAEGEDLIVKVRRSGGKAGAVSVEYATVSEPSIYYQFPATPGEDYEAAAGTLTWADGDASEREIVVPIRADTGAGEDYEGFRVALGDPQGGAGLGTRNALGTVHADGAPAGQFAIEVFTPQVNEATLAEIWVFRNYYVDGPVSVTVTQVAGTASTADFNPSPTTLTWADQDGEPKVVRIGIVDDADQESSETFTVQLSNPTGGAILGARADGRLTIIANDTPQRNGGGGSTGWLSVLLLGLAELLRRSHALRAAPLRPRARR
jgi:uncharacterized delta-60 repeat protein